jgi:DHA2 family multidrug resistance protein
MQGSVSASQDQVDWVLTSHIVAAAIMTPPTGYLASRFGLKHLFLVSVAGFTVASMLCGMSQSLMQIVLFRVLQDLFGAALVPHDAAHRLQKGARQWQGGPQAGRGMRCSAGYSRILQQHNGNFRQKAEIEK